jgi:hypothetical protein
MPLKGETRTKYMREYMRKRRADAAKAAAKAPTPDLGQSHHGVDWRKGKAPEQIAHLENLGQQFREASRQTEQAIELEREGLLEFREVAIELFAAHEKLIDAHKKLIDDYNELVDDYNALLDDEDEDQPLIEPPDDVRCSARHIQNRHRCGSTIKASEAFVVKPELVTRTKPWSLLHRLDAAPTTTSTPRSVREETEK